MSYLSNRSSVFSESDAHATVATLSIFLYYCLYHCVLCCLVLFVCLFVRTFQRIGNVVQGEYENFQDQDFGESEQQQQQEQVPGKCPWFILKPWFCNYYCSLCFTNMHAIKYCWVEPF